MPDHDRRFSFMHSLSQDPGDGDGVSRCPNCRGTAGVTFQADCVCCGREVALRAEDIANGVKTLSMKSEEVVPCSSQPLLPSFGEESRPVPVAAAGPRPSSERQQRRSILRSSHNHSERAPGGGVQEGKFVSLLQLQQPSSSGAPSSSARRGSGDGEIATRRLPSSRGGGRGADSGAHPSYRGVRTRKGVRGYLVEIRPPKWKRTIWLGTYNTSVEAAAAYDAGVYYTKRSKSKLYNFQLSEGAFQPMPPHLRLDRSSDMEEIKFFVQSAAKTAARAVACRMGVAGGEPQRGSAHFQTRTTPTTVTSNDNQAEPTSSSSCVTGIANNNSDSADSVSAMTGDVQAASISSTSSEVNNTTTEFSNMPMDFDFLAAEDAAKLFSDYSNYVSLQQEHDPETSLLEELDTSD